MSTKHYSIHPIIRQIINRDCHVGLSNRAVIRHVISKLRDGYATFREMPRLERREFLKQCVLWHQRNREEYVAVMGGSLGRNAAKPAAVEQPLSGKELRRLMRKHKVTIRELQRRLGITQKRIREVREHGLSDANAARDWVQGIIDHDPGPIAQRFRIACYTEECECEHCGAPLFVGDWGYQRREEVFCSRMCSTKAWEQQPR